MTEVATSSAEAIASTNASKDEVSKEVELLANGKRNLLCGEVTKAVNQLQEACRLLAAKYGDLDDRCGEAYLCYGSALLDLSRMESGVLGNALEGIEGDEEEASDKDDTVEDPEKCIGEEREKVSNEVIDAMLETDEELAARQKKDGTEEKKEEKTSEETEKTEEKTETAEAKTDAKIEEKTDAKTAEKTDAKTAEKTDAKTAEKTEAKTDEKTEAKTDEKTEAKTEEKTEAKTETKTEAKTEKKTDEKTEKKTDEKTEKKTDEKTEKKTVAKAEETEEAMETDDTKKDDKEGDAEEEVDEEGDTAEEGEEAETEEGDTAEEAEGEEAKKEKEDEDVSNLQLAWEILELAKVIYSKHDSKEMKLKAAEAYLKLGEVGLETEQYEQAIGDLRECLKLQQDHLEPESRLIAETHYQIGLACSFNTHHDDALKEFRLAVKTIETKIAKLTVVIEAAEAKGKGKEPASFDDPIVQAQKEVKDLREILPDILAKIEDTEDEKRNQERVKELVKENVASDLGTTTFGEAKSETTKMDTKDITHLVRKKRKPESETEVDDSKKAKTENGSGDTAVNGKSECITNGKAETNGKEAPTATA